MRFLVTGAAGFIGHNLIKTLLEFGHEVVGVDNFLTGERERTAMPYTFLECSMQALEYEALGKEISLKFDAVFHLAALPRVPVSFDNPQLSLANNIDSTIAALEIVRKYGGVFVYSSSSSIYGTQPVMPFVESMPANPESPYALGKWVGEELCEQYARSFGVPYIALRYFNVYGPGMTKGGYATAIRTFMEQRARGEELTVTGDGEQERDFTHVFDVVNANILAALKLVEGGREGVMGAYNIGAGEPRRLIDVARQIAFSDPAQKTTIKHVEARREPRKTHADNRKAKEILGWEPQQDFTTSLNELLAENL